MDKMWTTKIPKKDGWYWIQYKGKNGRVMCPCSVFYFKNNAAEYAVHTAYNDYFFNHSKKSFGWVVFGPEINIPNPSLKTKIKE